MPAAEHVLLNALFLDPNRSGGPESYLRDLTAGLRRSRPNASLSVVTTRRGATVLRDEGWPGRGVPIHALPCDDGERVRRQVAEQILLPRLARRLGVDVVHSLASVAPIRIRGCAHVITLHDVNFLRHRTFNAVTTWGMAQVIPRAARRADALITGTAVARDDICATLSIDPGRFTVIHHGAGRDPVALPTDPAGACRRLGVPDGRRIILCVGAKRPHKNQELLIRAAALLPQDAVVVLAGQPEPYERTLRAIASATAVEERVIFLDYVADDDLEALWARAAVAAFPTLAEGFGIPILEALARGVPVACSDLPVLREVGGDQPAFFDPRSPQAAAAAISGLLDAPPDARPGREWAQRFTWEAAAQATWNVYDRAVSAPRRSS